MNEHEKWMALALEHARAAAARGEIPVGAVIVKDGKLLSAAGNEREALHDVSAHAELLALRRAGEKTGRWTLTGCTLYVTLEPCPMCAGAIVQARPDAVVFGAFDPQMGAMGSVYAMNYDRRIGGSIPATGGVMQEECTALLQDFFTDRRRENG